MITMEGMTTKPSHSGRWKGSTGAAYFVSENLTQAERARIDREQLRRFEAYLTHAEDRWAPVIEAVAVEGLRIEHTGGGVMTLKFEMAAHPAEIWVGPFDADPEPSDEVSFGVCVLDEAGEIVDEWTEFPAGGLSNDSTTEELVDWLRQGLQSIQASLARRR